MIVYYGRVLYVFRWISCPLVTILLSVCKHEDHSDVYFQTFLDWGIHICESALWFARRSEGLMAESMLLIVEGKSCDCMAPEESH